MIDKSRKYWYGNCADDIDEFLKEYTEEADIDIKPVVCNSCGSEALIMRIDSNEEAIKIKCPTCAEKKIFLDVYSRSVGVFRVVQQTRGVGYK